MGKELEHRNHLLAELTGQQHLTLPLAIRHLAAAVVMAVGHHWRGGLWRHDAAAAVDLSSVLRQHPVHDGVAAHGLPQGGGGSHDGGGNGSDGRGGSDGRSGVAAAGIEVLVVEQLCGGEVGPLRWRRRTRVWKKVAKPWNVVVLSNELILLKTVLLTRLQNRYLSVVAEKRRSCWEQMLALIVAFHIDVKIPAADIRRGRGDKLIVIFKTI